MNRKFAKAPERPVPADASAPVIPPVGSDSPFQAPVMGERTPAASEATPVADLVVGEHSWGPDALLEWTGGGCTALSLRSSVPDSAGDFHYVLITSVEEELAAPQSPAEPSLMGFYDRTGNSFFQDEAGREAIMFSGTADECVKEARRVLFGLVDLMLAVGQDPSSPEHCDRLRHDLEAHGWTSPFWAEMAVPEPSLSEDEKALRAEAQRLHAYLRQGDLQDGTFLTPTDPLRRGDSWEGPGQFLYLVRLGGECAGTGQYVNFADALQLLRDAAARRDEAGDFTYGAVGYEYAKAVQLRGHEGISYVLRELADTPGPEAVSNFSSTMLYLLDRQDEGAMRLLLEKARQAGRIAMGLSPEQMD